MLSRRIATVAVLLPPFLAALFFLPTPWFALVISVIVLAAGWEWVPMAGVRRPSVRWAWLGGLALVMAAIGGVVTDGVLTPFFLSAGVLWWGVASIQLQRFGAAGGRAAPLPPGAGLAAGVFLLVPAWTGLVWLHAQPGGAWLVLLVLVLTWAADIGAYFAGRALGRRKLAPAISPGKTWEGAIGGLLLALLAGFLLRMAAPLPGIDAGLFALLVVVTVVVSVVGDLYESMVKRLAGVKDSGNLLPGHGGVLDRIDSVTATATLFAAGLYWLWA